MTNKQTHRQRYDKGQQRRDEILAAVLALFETRGLAEVSVRDLADAAGVPKSVVLYYFGSRDGLIEATLSTLFTTLLDAQRQAVAAPGDPREQLGHWLAPCFDPETGLGPLRLQTEIACAGGLRPARALLQDYLDETTMLLTELLERGHREFCWHAPDARRSARSVRALVDGMMLSCLREGPEVDLLRARRVCRGAVLDLLVS